MEKGTLVLGGIHFAKKDGKVVTISAGAVHPDIDGDDLAMIEYEFEEMWRRIRAKKSK